MVVGTCDMSCVSWLGAFIATNLLAGSHNVLVECPSFLGADQELILIIIIITIIIIESY